MPPPERCSTICLMTINTLYYNNNTHEIKNLYHFIPVYNLWIKFRKWAGKLLGIFQIQGFDPLCSAGISIASKHSKTTGKQPAGFRFQRCTCGCAEYFIVGRGRSKSAGNNPLAECCPGTRKSEGD